MNNCIFFFQERISEKNPVTLLRAYFKYKNSFRGYISQYLQKMFHFNELFC